MITQLNISNFAIVSNLDVEIYPGLNILSGETGAGKSIIIGALNLLLGERAQTEMIRSGEDMAVVEGHFSLNKQIISMLKELGIDAGNRSLEIRREVKLNSASRCFVNGQMVNVADLKRLGTLLVDLVGQHHQQLLLDYSNHIVFLDQFANHGNILEKYHNLFENYQSAKQSLKELRDKINRDQERIELYRFQLHEIDRARLSHEEEQGLNRERQILENAETLKGTYHQVSEELYSRDGSVTEIVNQAISRLEALLKYDDSLKDTIDSIRSGMYSLQEAGRHLESRSSEIEHDPGRLQEIQDRLDIYYDLKKKYGGSLERLFAYRQEISEFITSYSDSSDNLGELGQKVDDMLSELIALAEKLSDNRHKSAKKLSREIEKVLKSLLMDKVRFDVSITPAKSSRGEYEKDGERYMLGQDGFDVVEFLFSPNPGEELKALSKIASGGELSRVLLAIKSIVSGKYHDGCLIFDEIDSGIGGKTASAVGKKLEDLARDHQVLVITHLQQIAARGQNHFLVFKEESNGRMITRIRKLTLKQRKEEIGRMISGDRITSLSLKQAEEMLKKSATE